MKIIFFLSLIFSLNALATFLPACPPNTMRTYDQSMGYSCVQRYSPVSPIGGCFPNWQQPGLNPFQGFPGPIYQPQALPWWAYQGNMYYPNVAYPGPWQYPGIQSHYYPGQGEVFAAKPNVYVNTIHQNKKFNFKFTAPVKPQFLAVTPILNSNLAWNGRIQETDKFEVDGILYDYLFYDVRLPKEKMQFENGFCATREGAIDFMLKDLKEMKHPAISLQDFEEHWRVKIPDYPYYCIYPQYNRELDPVIPIEIDVEQSTFTRSLYVLVPHKKEPDINDPQSIPFPTKDPAEFRPDAKILRENMFREWGVAFLGY